RPDASVLGLGEDRHAAQRRPPHHPPHPLGHRAALGVAGARPRRHRGDEPVVRRRARGYSLIEISVTLALFGIFLFIIVTLTAEMRRNEKRWPINWLAHPDISAVVSCLRREL